MSSEVREEIRRRARRRPAARQRRLQHRRRPGGGDRSGTRAAAARRDGGRDWCAYVCELTDLVDLSAWPEGSRLICRRERAHPGAQLSLIDTDGWRHTCFLTDQTGEDIAELDRHHRAHAHVEQRICANAWQTFWRVTLPAIRWGVAYGVVLTTARVLGEFGAVTIVSGSISGQTETLPLFVAKSFDNFNEQAAYAGAIVLALLALTTLLLMSVGGRKAKAIKEGS